MKKTKGPSILDGTDEVINRHLFGVSDTARMYQQKSSAAPLRELPQHFNASALLDDLLERIGGNRRPNNAHPGQNWRKDPQIDKKGSTSEIKTERAVVNEALRQGQTWWNQMPIASGFAGQDADRRRAIDLVHMPDSNTYQFIELKVTTRSGNPLYAMMEIVRYGLVYLALRKNREWRPTHSPGFPVFDARGIVLNVLAPHGYFKGYQLGWLEDSISEGLQKLAGNITGGTLNMSLSCCYPAGWETSAQSPEDAAQAILKDWKPAFRS